jgi:hypothetical protein
MIRLFPGAYHLCPLLDNIIDLIGEVTTKSISVVFGSKRIMNPFSREIKLQVFK